MVECFEHLGDFRIKLLDHDDGLHDRMIEICTDRGANLMYCLKCGGKLERQHDDSKEGEIEEYYNCGVCGTDHTKRVDYQSSLIANNELYIEY